ncbi:MAG TPA: histidine kinase N-terminal 7TM domain-containing protein, partial [Bryobacteraceae bacterium]|nr:histidine kinase N-terminal 7TM domain-containing protein [Bryobacteraceae bacterium]
MQEPKSQFAGTLLLILTVAALVAGILSFQHLRDPRHGVPDDGVTWVDSGAGKPQGPVMAVFITRGGPGDKARIHLGDQVVKIGPYPIHDALDVAKALWQLPIDAETTYTLRRNGIEFQKDHIFIQAAPRDSAVFYQYVVGIAYLVIGFFVYYRRTNAAKSLQFFVLCLVSFIASSFHYSGKLNTFDELMYWGNVAAGLFAPAIFLHFCLTFHEIPRWLHRRAAWLLLYLPSFALLALMIVAADGSLRFATPLLEVRWFLDRLSLGFEMVLYFAGAAALAVDYARSEDPVLRRQLKYLRNGAVVGLLPFAVLYVAPYLAGSVPTHIMNLSVLSLGLIPLTWAYAITRYRLMDVDIIFQQGYVYTLATLAVIGTFYVLIFLIFNTSTITPPAFVVLISFATFVFQPIRRWIQEQLDRRIFYRDRYDARLTLIEFARELSSETDLNRMLASVSDRLLKTLSIHQIAFFLADDSRNQFHLHSITQKSGRPPRLALTASLDLRFLEQPETRDYLFFERPKHLRDIVSQAWPQSVRDTLAELDFTYYVACRSRGRVISYFGVSRTTDGDFLSSDDIDLLITLSRYVAIAIENTRLYSSLQRQVNEYERLKEFSENIVESINVGILAVDLNDCVESWNTQIEKLTGIIRRDAVGRRLCDLFSPELCQKFDEVRGEAGIHNAYKVPLRPRFDMLKESSNGNGNGHSRPAPRESLVNVAIA